MQLHRVRPDQNENDLALFRALDVAIRKSRRGMRQSLFDKEKPVLDVYAAADAYPQEQFEKMWKYKSSLMQAVKVDGGKDGDRHRTECLSG